MATWFPKRRALIGLFSVLAAPVGAYTFWTRKCYWEPIKDSVDSILTSAQFKRYNPANNPTLIDAVVRPVQLSSIEPHVLEDYKRGGTLLIEQFCGSVWAGSGFSLQRRLWARIFRNIPDRELQLWDPDALQKSLYAPGTLVVNHLKVIRKTPQAILFRACKDPATAPEEPVEHDSLVEIRAEPGFEDNVIMLSIKTAMYQGKTATVPDRPPMEKMQWLHKRYTEVLLESAVARFVAVGWQIVR